MAAGARQGGGRITQASIEAVSQRADILDLVAAYTQLHRRGAEHAGRCPFHEERTASFYVNPTKGVYHCFGCGAKGDAIGFIQAKQNLDFVEAVEVLADRYRVQLEFEDGGSGAPRRSKRRLYEVSDAAAAFYEASLWRAAEAVPVREYLQARNISEEAARAFRLGYSPESGSVLAAKALAKGFTEDELAEARLTTAKGTDFFRGRLMVPIVDRAKRVIGFGGRKLREEQFGGKYINSSDGPLFHKKQVLFLAPGIAEAARDAGSVVVVEGYMDVIAMWQAGLRNACAVMGTALTEEQVLELKRIAPRALFAFDPDTAGQVATMRALDQARAAQLDVRVILLPDGEDPADVLQGGEGRDRMDELLSGGVSLLHYRTSSLLGSGDLADGTDRDRIYREAVTLFRSTPDGPARREQIARVANALQLDGDASKALYNSTGAEAPMRLVRQGSREPGFREERAVRSRVAQSSPRSTAVVREKRLLASALRLAEGGSTRPLAELLPSEEAFALDVHRRARTLLLEGGSDALAPARVRGDRELFELVTELATLADRDRLDGGDPETLAATVAELARSVELQYVDRRLGELRAATSGAGDEVDTELLVEHAALRRRMRELDPRLADPSAD